MTFLPILMVAALAGQAAPAHPPPPAEVQVGVYAYQADGGIPVRAYSTTLDSVVWATESLCHTGVGRLPAGPPPAHAWTFSGTIISKTERRGGDSARVAADARFRARRSRGAADQCSSGCTAASRCLSTSPRRRPRSVVSRLWGSKPGHEPRRWPGGGLPAGGGVGGGVRWRRRQWCRRRRREWCRGRRREWCRGRRREWCRGSAWGVV